jgi:GT2 family glycosyltransferase
MKLPKRAGGLAWKLKTAFTKKRIQLEDRYGLFRYEDWIKENESQSTQTPGRQYKVKNGDFNPKFCFIIPLEDSRSGEFLITYQAILQQVYPLWMIQLIGNTQEIAQQISTEQDPRVRLNPSSPVSEIPGSIIETIGRIDDDYIILVNPGDVPRENLLWRMTEIVRAEPGIDVLYWDEDQLGVDGRTRQNPLFKPDWSPELMISINYLLHAAFRVDLLKSILRQVIPGTVNHFNNLVFRSAESAAKIHHIPEILYHNAHSGRLLQFNDPSDYCRDVADHIARTGVLKSQVFLDGEDQVRVSWLLEPVRVSIIIPTIDNLTLLQKCILSIQENTKNIPYEIILVDSGSSENATLSYYDEISHQPDIHLLHYECADKFNYNVALNLGARESRGEILLFLNNDTEVLNEDWLVELTGWASQPAIGVVGAKMLYPDGSIQHAGIVMGLEGHASHIFGGLRGDYSGVFGNVDWYRNYSAVTGACMAVRRSVYEEVGGFDEEYQLVFSDVQFCLQVLKAGYRNIYTPYARLIHHEGQSRSRYIPYADIQRAYAHFKDIVGTGDPYYNRNLSTSIRIPTFKRSYEQPASDRLDKIVSTYVE